MTTPISPLTNKEYEDPQKEFWHNPAWSTSKRWSPPTGDKVLRCLPTEACKTDAEYDECLNTHVADCDEESCCERTVLDARYKLRPPKTKKGIPKSSRYPFATGKSDSSARSKKRLVVDYRAINDKERMRCDPHGVYSVCPKQPTTWSEWVWKQFALWQPQKAHNILRL